MSSIEERLRRDIAAVTQGVIVTESDLQDARESVEEHIELGRDRDRRRLGVVAAAAAVAIPILGYAAFQTLDSDRDSGAPATPAPTTADPFGSFLTGAAPTPESIDGVWRLDGGETLVHFDADGSMRLDNSGRLFTAPALLGTYEIDGSDVTVTIADGPEGCAGKQLALRGSHPGPGSFHFVVEAASQSCLPEPSMLWTLEEVLPTSNDFLAGLRLTDTKWDPAEARVLYGDWMAEVADERAVGDGANGYILELTPDNRYVVASGDDESGVEVLDSGTWALDGAQLTFVTEGDPTTCNQGDRVILSNVQVQLSGMPSGLRGTVQQNSCGGEWASESWLWLPHQGG